MLLRVLGKESLRSLFVEMQIGAATPEISTENSQKNQNKSTEYPAIPVFGMCQGLDILLHRCLLSHDHCHPKIT